MITPEALRSYAGLRHDVITRVEAVMLGMSESQWQRGFNGLLTPIFPGIKGVVGEKPATRDQLRGQKSRAAVIVGGPGAAACLGSALRIAGVWGTPLDDPEHVLLAAAGWHQRAGIRRHWFAVDDADRSVHAGTALVDTRRSLLDVGAAYDDAHLLSVIDSALHHKLIRLPDTAMLKHGLPSRAAIIGFADARRESPLESRAALLMARNQTRDVVPQVEIEVPGYGLARVDFTIGRRVIVECDGGDAHDELSARHVDRVRHEALEHMGYIVVRVTWFDVVHNPGETLRRIRRALADAEALAAGWLPPAAVAR